MWQSIITTVHNEYLLLKSIGSLPGCMLVQDPVSKLKLSSTLPNLEILVQELFCIHTVSSGFVIGVARPSSPAPIFEVAH